MSACPDSDALSRFANGACDEAAAGEIENHLDHCGQCRAWLDVFFQSSLPPNTGTSGKVPRHLIDSAIAATRPEAADHALPRRVGDYDLLEIIGRGGMGVVYRAIDRNLNREVAVKALSPALLANPAAIERFQREARAAAALEHENVLPVHAFGGLDDGSGFPFIAMPLVRGESLEARLLRDGRLSVSDTLDIAKQIAAGLSAAHEAGIVHRDIKPANILIDTGSKALIADFGLARMDDDAALTLPDARAGTPHFMAPEQALGGTVSQASDLFCFGAMLHRMLSGELPFPGNSSTEVLHALATKQPSPVRKIRADVPAWLSHLIEALLEKNPGERPASARLVGEMLATESAPGHPSRRQRRVRRRIAFASIFLIVAGLFVVSELSGRSILINSGLSAINGQPFSIRGKWGTFKNLDTAWEAVRDGQTIEVRQRGDLSLRAPASSPKSVTLVGTGSGRLLETKGRTIFHGRGQCLIENLTIVRTGSGSEMTEPLIAHSGGTLTIRQCRILFDKAPNLSQFARRESVLRLDDASLTAHDSVLRSNSTYLIHNTGDKASRLTFENCGLRGFALLVIDGAPASLTVDLRQSTLSALGCFLSPRRRAFPNIIVTGERNILRCGVLVWKNDKRAIVLDAIDWQMRDSVLGEFRSLFARDESIRQSSPDSETIRNNFAIRWPDAAASLQITDDLGMPKQQQSDSKRGEFAPADEWSEYGRQE